MGLNPSESGAIVPRDCWQLRGVGGFVLKRFLAVVSIAGTIAAPSTAVAAARALPTLAAAPAKMCGPGYVHANLPWGEKCLHAGEFCKVGNPAYLKYGFYCPASGHLRRR